MPLRDHFHLATIRRSAWWDAVLGGWPAMMTAALNRTLPEQYAASPRISIRSIYPIDPAECDDDPDVAHPVTTWAPPAPSLTVPAEWSGVDRYEVLIHDDERGQELVAAIEFVSPSNKDRPKNRRLFINKCTGLLQAGVAVAIIDMVTNHEANLYTELLDAVGQADRAVTKPPQPIYAVSCRTRAAKQGQALETWFHPLAVGKALPTLPIWLTERLAVPLELEPIYEETLKALRIR